MELLTYNESNFSQEVLQTSKPVLVVFSATWCGPCKVAKISMEHVASEYRTYINVGVVDIDESINLATEYNIKGVPTILLFNGGNIIEKFNGPATKKALSELVEKYLRDNKIL